MFIFALSLQSNSSFVLFLHTFMMTYRKKRGLQENVMWDVAFWATNTVFTPNGRTTMNYIQKLLWVGNGVEEVVVTCMKAASQHIGLSGWDEGKPGTPSGSILITFRTNSCNFSRRFGTTILSRKVGHLASDAAPDRRHLEVNPNSNCAFKYNNLHGTRCPQIRLHVVFSSHPTPPQLAECQHGNIPFCPTFWRSQV